MAIEFYIAGGVALVAARVTGKVVWRAVAPKVRGALGELRVRSILSTFRSKKFARANDILIPHSHNHGTSQLDHVLVSRHGIFVIETKNYSGKVKGKKEDKEWTQIYKNGSRRTFLNPILQNEAHIRSLRKALDEYPDVPYHNIVVFADKCKTPWIPHVIHMSTLRHTIKEICKGEPSLSVEDVQRIKQRIDEVTITDKDARTLHKAYAKLAAEMKSEPTGAKEEKVSISEHESEETKRLYDLARMKSMLTDTGAMLKINGVYASISEHYESSKRDINGRRVPDTDSFEHFVCPYTNSKFPASEAVNFYKGMWISYLNKHPELTDFMADYGPTNLGNNMRSTRVFVGYMHDTHKFVTEARNNDWYRNMASRRNPRSKPLDEFISTAEQRKQSEQNPYPRNTNLQKSNFSYNER